MEHGDCGQGVHGSGGSGGSGHGGKWRLEDVEVVRHGTLWCADGIPGWTGMRARSCGNHDFAGQAIDLVRSLTWTS